MNENQINTGLSLSEIKKIIIHDTNEPLVEIIENEKKNFGSWNEWDVRSHFI